MDVKIYGFGWVGQAMHKLFPDALVVDPAYFVRPNERPCDVAFVCVPTPLKDGKLDSSIVEQVIRDSREDLIIVRSTVMPGTCDQFRDKNVCFVPEYLGESVAHPLLDMAERPFLIIGGAPTNRRRVIELYQSVYNANIRIRQVSNYEAEVIKLSENRAIMFRVAQCQELFEICEAAGVDYYTIREAVLGDDSRFNLYWSFVYPDKRGCNSKCIPKDIFGFVAWAESIGVDAPLTKALLAYNETLIHDQVRA